MKSIANKKVLLALSGGVDSAVSGLLLQRQGYSCYGAYMRLTDSQTAENGAAAAESVAAALDIPFIVVDLIKDFSQVVLAAIDQTYRSGKTPNPCVICNRQIKFALFPRLAAAALEIEADFFATGHYASIVRRGGRLALRRGSDPQKEQSYFLSLLGQQQLQKIIFPLAAYHKTAVRQIARESGLPVADRGDSQDLCIGDYRHYLVAQTDNNTRIVDIYGNVLAERRRISDYTIGQRRGLKLAVGRPLYVVKIDPQKNEITVGDAAMLLEKKVIITNIKKQAVERIFPGMKGCLQTRYRSAAAAATVLEVTPDRVVCQFSTPQQAIAPGQIAVFYKEDAVAFAGFID